MRFVALLAGFLFTTSAFAEDRVYRGGNAYGDGPLGDCKPAASWTLTVAGTHRKARPL